ncbi:MAG TPA: hypothetical protein VNZ45_18800 [Bacteroidia bacterium]|jgi:hypothetical protein|nr:hypothetical protein [Bacteroidia bacterium]
MKKHLLFLSLLFIAFTGISQVNPLDNPLIIDKGMATIDGKGSSNYTYICTSKDSVWTASYANIPDNENIRVMYSKTTAGDCTINFPTGTVFSQPDIPGVKISGLKVALSSSANGSFMIILIRAGAAYNLQITRLAP